MLPLEPRRVRHVKRWTSRIPILWSPRFLCIASTFSLYLLLRPQTCLCQQPDEQAFTLQLDDRRTAVRVTDSKVEAREIFLEKDELPKPGGLNPLLDLLEKNYAIEIFYFPGSGLDIKHILSSEFEDQKWDTYSDICTIKAFQRTDKPVAKDNDYCCGINSKSSTRFDRNFGISDWVTINLGTRLGLPLIWLLAVGTIPATSLLDLSVTDTFHIINANKPGGLPNEDENLDEEMRSDDLEAWEKVLNYGDKPLLVASYSRAAAKAFEPFGKLKGEVVYEQSLAQVTLLDAGAIHWQKYITNGYPSTNTEVCIKCDPDLTSAYKAIHSVLAITKSFAEDEDTMPLNVAMEIRFTEYSDCPLSPAYGKKGDMFLWIEILSAVGTPKVKEYHTRVADAWLAITLKDGSQAVRPHWAKWSDAYVADADAKLKKAYAGRLLLLKDLANHFDPEGMFMNDHFSRLFSGL